MFAKKLVKFTTLDGKGLALALFSIDRVEELGARMCRIVTFGENSTVHTVNGLFDDVVAKIEEAAYPK